MTRREKELCVVLCHHLRILSIDQIARGWWPPNRDARWRARADVNRLAQAKWLIPVTVLARPLLELPLPIFAWVPGDAEPDYSLLEDWCRERWECPAVQTEVAVAGRRALDVFGGSTPGGVKNACQTTHDLHVGEVFLRYRACGLKWRTQWVGEDAVAARWGWKKIPDAVLCDADGSPVRAVDFGGAYRDERLRDFHAACAAKSLPYELW